MPRAGLALYLGASLMVASFPLEARAGGPLTFVDVSAARGIEPYVMANPGDWPAGFAAADYDDDGFVDVFVPNAAGVPDQLYHNLGDGTFEEIAGDVGLASTFENQAGLWFDYDGDGDLDLFVVNDIHTAPTSYRLYRQESDGQFVDVTVEAGLFIPPVNQTFNHHRGGVCAGDLNQDRYLDLISAVWNGPTHVFLNNGDGTFSNISVSSQIGPNCTPGVNCPFSHQTMLADFNEDGWLDLSIALDVHFGDPTLTRNQLWINQKDGTFVNMAVAAGAANAMNDMGMTLGDYDNDGDLDMYITNIFDTDPQTLLPEYNILLRNDSTGGVVSFTEVAVSLGVDYGGWGWGTTFADADNDGWIDIFATNGWRSGGLYVNDPSKCYMNTGGDPVGFTDESDNVQFNDTFYGAGLIAFDFDRDGDLDLMQSCQSNPPFNSTPLMRLLENQQTAGGNNYLVVKPRMAGPNHHAIGAIVRIAAGGLNQMRLITAGTSYLCQEPAEAFFGLGGSTLVDSLSIEWPDGSQTTLERVSPNQVLTVLHGGFGDLDADGEVDDADQALFLACYTGSGPGPGTVLYAAGCQPADMNGDGDVDCDDWQVFESAYLAAQGGLPTLPVEDFVAVLLGIDTSEASGCAADLDDSGQPDGRDVAPFVAAVLAGS